MRLKIEIEMENDAFEGEEMPFEVKRILRELADKLGEFAFSAPAAKVIYPIHDVNGNRTGYFKFTGGRRIARK